MSRGFIGLLATLSTVSFCRANDVALNNRGLTGQGVRLVDSSGGVSNAGLLQVRTSDTETVAFGTVCGLNLAAADVVCAQLGYDFGTVSTSPCESYGGSNVCGASGTPVAMAALTCTGGELDIQDCSYEAPDAQCASHESDSVVFCGTIGGVGSVESGALRLIGADGAPTVDGIGRLEIFSDGAWGPVCSSGFTVGAATVACKAMGFAGASPDGVSRCGTAGGKDFCNSIAPQISEVACTGQEDGLLSCPHVGVDDVFCAPEESVLLHCAGSGDAQGRPKKSVVPAVGFSA